MIRQGLKIGFMGAGGTGKTTDATALSEELGVPMIKSASRTALERLGVGEAEVLKMTDEEKWKLQLEIFNSKEELDDHTFEFIGDRTLLDHFVYCLMYCATFIPATDFFAFENNVRKHMKSTYTHMFYYPWGYWNVQTSDGVRQDAPGWQSAIDALIVGYIRRWNLPVIQVPQTQGKEFRQAFVKRHILGEKR